ncbi:chlororespiratory reduction protein 7 [Gloeobacter violaceus]|uniref:Gsl0285 protein n=1 Tax=Gloeobacter violaceus (strain ATCC 29082 / PCC 7421) TaxID=251221 RepID=Q7NNX3_GLOVI|nr:chlororespiratory reduction protein 7 [Gloeobacter violaceus]BAC88226.1 gsl0285 [Gloeobacter violaceus PCC 7421]
MDNDAEYYVLLRTGQEEQFLTEVELQAVLADAVRRAEGLEGEALAHQVKFLLDTACDYPTLPGEYLQWYSVRLEKK